MDDSQESLASDLIISSSISWPDIKQRKPKTNNANFKKLFTEKATLPVLTDLDDLD